MGEPEGDEKTEQAAREIANKQENEELLALKRKEVLAKLLAPNNLLGLLSLYFLFVGAVVAFGVLAFYTGHKTTQEIIFFISAALFLVPPIGALWFLFPLFIKKATLGKLMDRIIRSPLSTSLARLTTNHIFRLGILALYAFNIVNAIYLFPKHPRFSLALLTVSVAFPSWLLITWALEALKRDIYHTFSLVVELSEQLQRIANAAYNTAMSAHEYIKTTEPSHDEAHRTTVAALRKIFDTLELVATTERHLIDPPLKEIAGRKAEGDEEPDKP
jgi:hypothetical protein